MEGETLDHVLPEAKMNQIKIFLLFLVLIFIAGCIPNSNQWSQPYEHEALGIRITNLHDNKEVERQFYIRFQLGTSKAEILKELKSIEHGEKFFFLEDDGNIVSEIPITDNSFVQVGFFFESEKLESIHAVGTNVSLR